MLLDERQELLVDELAHRVAREPLLVGEQLVEAQEVEALEAAMVRSLNRKEQKADHLEFECKRRAKRASVR